MLKYIEYKNEEMLSETAVIILYCYSTVEEIHAFTSICDLLCSRKLTSTFSKNVKSIFRIFCLSLKSIF